MDILAKEPKYFKEPWPHIEIDNFLEEEFAQHVVSKFGSEPLKSTWWNFLQKKEGEYIKQFEKIFNKSFEGLTFEELNWVPWPGTETRERLKPIHCDGPAKKYQILMYFGTKTPTGGELTFNNGDSEEVLKNFPFTHNKLIMWEATNQTWHTFYSLVGDTRYTLNIPLSNPFESLKAREDMLVFHEKALKLNGTYDKYIQELENKKQELAEKYGNKI